MCTFVLHSWKQLEQFSMFSNNLDGYQLFVYSCRSPFTLIGAILCNLGILLCTMSWIDLWWTREKKAIKERIEWNNKRKQPTNNSAFHEFLMHFDFPFLFLTRQSTVDRIMPPSQSHCHEFSFVVFSNILFLFAILFLLLHSLDFIFAFTNQALFSGPSAF